MTDRFYSTESRVATCQRCDRRGHQSKVRFFDSDEIRWNCDHCGKETP